MEKLEYEELIEKARNCKDIKNAPIIRSIKPLELEHGSYNFRMKVNDDFYFVSLEIAEDKFLFYSEPMSELENLAKYKFYSMKRIVLLSIICSYNDFEYINKYTIKAYNIFKKYKENLDKIYDDKDGFLLETPFSKLLYNSKNNPVEKYKNGIIKNPNKTEDKKIIS